MHAMVFRITIHDRPEADRLLNEKFVPGTAQAPGFVAGYWVQTGENGGTSVIAFDSEEAARRAAHGMPRSQSDSFTVDRSTSAKSSLTPQGDERSVSCRAATRPPAHLPWTPCAGSASKATPATSSGESELSPQDSCSAGYGRTCDGPHAFAGPLVLVPLPRRCGTDHGSAASGRRESWKASDPSVSQCWSGRPATVTSRGTTRRSRCHARGRPIRWVLARLQQANRGER